MARSIIGAWDAMDKAGILAVIDATYPSKAELARQVGVSDRSAQRWFTEGSEKRGISASNLEKLKQLLPAVEIRITGLFLWDSPKGSKRTPDQRARDITFAVGQDYMPALVAAILAGDEERAEAVALEAYGMINDDQEQQPLIPNGQFIMEPLEAFEE